MPQMYMVAIKCERHARQRKWPVYRYCVLAADEQTALARMQQTFSESGRIVSMRARLVEEGIVMRDIYMADNGDPFGETPPPDENPLFAE